MKALIILTAALLATAATAGEPPAGGSNSKSMKSSEAKFEALDRDRDRALSKREAKGDASIATQFDSMDINLDGYISRSEYLAYLERAAQPRSPQE